MEQEKLVTSRSAVLVVMMQPEEEIPNLGVVKLSFYK